jgi:hypothetical protein
MTGPCFADGKRQMANGIWCEPLEPRRLYTAVHLTSHQVLEVIGSAAPNVITVGLSPDKQSIVATISFNTKQGAKQISNSFATGNIRAVYISGGPGADLITVDQTNGSFPVPSEIVGGNGNDTIYGGDEPDNIFGGGGADYIDAGGGNNRVLGQGGNDTVISNGSGDNIFVGGPGADSLVGGSGNDILFGQAGSDTLIGNDGNDQLRGGPGHDLELGGAGNDTLFDPDGPDTLMGGAGENTFVVYHIYGKQVNDYDPTQDKLRRIPPPSTDGFWSSFFNNYFLPFGV